MDVDAATAALDGRAGLADWTTLGFSATETVDGRPCLSIVDMGSSGSAFTVVRGRLPRGAGEIAVGAHTADDRRTARR